MIRILHIVSSAAPSGTTKQLALLSGALPRSQFDFRLVVLDAGGIDAAGNHDQYLQRAGLEPIFLGRHAMIDPLSFHRLRRHVLRLRPDIVHTWQSAAGVYGRLAALSAGVKKLIAQAEAIDVGRSDFGWWLDRRLSRFTDRIITNSVAVRQFYMAHGLPASKFATIPKPIRPAEPARLERPEFLAQLGLPDNAKLILCLGALVKEKRLKELIWAVDQLKAVGVPAHLLVVGVGPLRKPLERYRRLNRIDDRVHFLGQREDVAELVAQADVLWQAGAHEGHSSAILEAMVAGKPVVAADAAGNGELVVNGVTGHLVPVRERAGFARWTLPLLENVELARRLGEAGKQRVLENHHVENIAQQYGELYRSLSRS